MKITIIFPGRSLEAAKPTGSVAEVATLGKHYFNVDDRVFGPRRLWTELKKINIILIFTVNWLNCVPNAPDDSDSRRWVLRNPPKFPPTPLC